MPKKENFFRRAKNRTFSFPPPPFLYFKETLKNRPDFVKKNELALGYIANAFFFIGIRLLRKPFSV